MNEMEIGLLILHMHTGVGLAIAAWHGMCQTWFVLAGLKVLA